MLLAIDSFFRNGQPVLWEYSGAGAVAGQVVTKAGPMKETAYFAWKMADHLL